MLSVFSDDVAYPSPNTTDFNEMVYLSILIFLCANAKKLYNTLPSETWKAETIQPNDILFIKKCYNEGKDTSAKRQTSNFR